MKRRLATLSPLLATLLLTGAALLLPATSDRRQAQASDADGELRATYIGMGRTGAPQH